MRPDIAYRARLIGWFGVLLETGLGTARAEHFVAVAENGLNGGDAGASKFFAKKMNHVLIHASRNDTHWP